MKDVCYNVYIAVNVGFLENLKVFQAKQSG